MPFFYQILQLIYNHFEFLIFCTPKTTLVFNIGNWKTIKKNQHFILFVKKIIYLQLVHSFRANLGSKNLKGSLGYCFCTFAMSSAYLPRENKKNNFISYKINERYLQPMCLHCNTKSIKEKTSEVRGKLYDTQISITLPSPVT